MSTTFAVFLLLQLAVLLLYEFAVLLLYKFAVLRLFEFARSLVAIVVERSEFGTEVMGFLLNTCPLHCLSCGIELVWEKEYVF